ncbi:lipid II flippase Amj family protein [Pelotomaculum propionicicum]|uniref:lipid II flippase Amj family protein n=1 Tax=Pelotomaculum propionicicum TaxID=258475 RepID=UPI003B828BED
MDRLLIVAALTAVIHFINTLAYAIRISGVRTRRLATAFSIFNVIFLVASTANTIQAPILASIVEMVIKTGQTQTGARVTDAQLVNSAAYQALLVSLSDNIRIVILAATAGTIIAAALIPAFVNIFNRAIFLFEETGSVPRMLGSIIISPRRFMKAGGQIYLAGRSSLKLAAKKKMAIPKTFLFLNIIVTGVYTTGVLSAIYAGALFPGFRSTATLLSAVVNGVATILAATVVEPTAAAITDQALREERGDEDVKQMVLYLTLTRILGTVFAQLIFLPSAYLVKYVAALLA